MKILSSLVFVGAVACGQGSKSSSTSAPPPAPPASARVNLSGTLSLETSVGSAELFAFAITPKGETVALALESQSVAADGTFAMVLPPGALAVATDTVILMSKTPVPNQPDMILWSFSVAPGAEATSNINVLTSIAYEIGVLETSLGHIAAAAQRTSAAFGTDGVLEHLDPKDAKLVALGKVVTLVGTQLGLPVGAVHKAVARDLADGTLDGKNVDEPVTLGTKVGTYAVVLSALKAIAQRETPDFAALSALTP